MAQVVEKTTAEEEGTFHAYTGNAIPWYVRLLWILFWWGIMHGMFRDIERPKYTMLENERKLDEEDGEDLAWY